MTQNTPDSPEMTVTLGALLSMSTGVLLTEFPKLHAAIEHLAAGPVWTHQLPDAMDAIHPFLLMQHPWLADIARPGVLRSEQDVRGFLAPLIASHGDEHVLTPVPGGWSRDPLKDLVERMGADRVVPVAVVADGETAPSSREG